MKIDDQNNSNSTLVARSSATPSFNSVAAQRPNSIENLSPNCVDQNSEIENPSTGRPRHGGIARLPRETRLRVNEMLDDHFTANEIIAALGEEGHGLNKDVISRWKSGGYQDYLRDQRLIAQCRARTDRALELLSQASPIHSFQATQQIAAAQICEAISGSGPEILREALDANPLNYFRMLNSFARLTTGGLKCERHLADEAERAPEKTPPQPLKKGLSQAAIKEMVEALKLM